MKITIAPKKLTGSISPPPSKSLAHRAMLAASMAEGTSTISNVEMSEDMEATLNAITAWGCDVEKQAQNNKRYTIKITGKKIIDEPLIDCGESGSTLRFVIPLALVRCGGGTFTGRGRLGQRPLTPYETICSEQGIRWEAAEDGLPLKVAGRLAPGKYELPGNISSQFVTGLLMALPMLQGNSVLKVEGKLESRPYVDLTLDVLRHYGIAIHERVPGRFDIPGGQCYQATDYSVEGDWSQAAFLMVMGAQGGGMTIEGLNRESKQGDRAIVGFLEEMGADLSWNGTTLHVKQSKLKAGRMDLTNCPDLAPPIAAACAAASGVSTLKGIKRLRLKESDRVESIASALSAVGIKVMIESDRMLIEGGYPMGGSIDAAGDHRIAMLAAVLSPSCSTNVTVNGAEVVKKSWPSFWEDMKALGGELS